MRRREEAKLLEPCRAWFARFLRESCRGATVTILGDTDRKQLRYALTDSELAGQFAESSAWEVKVDVAAVMQAKSKLALGFVELKAKPISLVDLGQLLGYCRVCRPAIAFLLSPDGPSADLYRLLTTYGRTDILAFEHSEIRVGTWDCARGAPDWGTLIPSGVLRTVRL